MCQLLGMSANVPTDICFSFRGLMVRGGEVGPHRDGWGIAFYEDSGCRSFHDPQASADSEIAKLISSYPIKSTVVISHIRQANVGEVNLANTHPFTRELWGRMWTYAHNGQLDDRWKALPLPFYRPVGTTDSERAFCWMLGCLREAFPEPPEDRDEIRRLFKACGDRLHDMGVANFMISDGLDLMTYCSNKLQWLTRRSPFGEAHLSDADLAVDFEAETTPRDIVTVIATEPLTDNEEWTAMKPGDFVTFVDGVPQLLADGD